MGHRPRDLDKERFWRRALARRERTGQTVREFCLREGLKESTYHFWRRELKRRGTPPRREASPQPAGKRLRPLSFLPVSLGRAPSPIELVLPDGTTIRIGADCKEQQLGMVLRAWEHAQC